MRLAKVARLALALTVATAASAADLGAQAANDPDVAAKQRGAKPAGWEVRADRANADLSGLNFSMGGNGMRVTSGPAAIFFDSKHSTSGPFVAEATFTQLKKPAHAEAFGLIWGGTDLKADNQQYFYLIVRGDGKYMVKHRAGSETHELVPWTEHAAVTKEGADGTAKTTLKVESTASGVKLFANGKLFKELPANATSDGVVGVRVNHNLDVAIDGFSLKKP